MKINKLNLKPITENGEISDKDFDKRFKIDRSYLYESLFYKARIRFVQYPNEEYIRVYLTKHYFPNITKPILNKAESTMNVFWIFLSQLFFQTKDWKLSKEDIKNKFEYIFE